MFDKTFAVFLGKNTENAAAGFVVENGLFCALEIEEKEAENKIRLITEKIRGSLLSSSINNLGQFTDFAENIVKEHNLTSYSAGWLYESQLFFYAHSAAILLNRLGSLYKIISGSKTLKGSFRALDNYFFVTRTFSAHFKISELQAILKVEEEPKQIVDKLKEKNDENATGVFLVVQTTKPEIPNNPDDLSAVVEPVPVHAPNYFTRPEISEKKTLLKKLNLKSKYLKIALLGLVTLFILFKIVSEITNIIRARRAEDYNKAVAAVSQELQAINKSILENPSKSLQKLNTIKQTVIDLESKYPNIDNQPQELKKQIADLQKNYGTAKTNKEKLFFDLSLINKKAKIDYAQITENYIAIIDQGQKAAYLINIESKKNNSFSLKAMRSPTLITEYDENIYVFDKNKSVYKSEGEALFKQVPQDKELGKIIDLKVFNKNIYLLDSIKDEIYKYTPIEGGYGSKISYFQSGQGLDLAEAKNMAIDFSVYILTSSNLFKYTGGNSASIQIKNLDLAKISMVYKNPSDNYIYLLDNATARIIAVNEEGRLIKSVFNPKLKNVQFFGVYKDDLIIFIEKNRLYVLDNF